jgi:hypothetical protein
VLSQLLAIVDLCSVAEALLLLLYATQLYLGVRILDINRMSFPFEGLLFEGVVSLPGRRCLDLGLSGRVI